MDIVNSINKLEEELKLRGYSKQTQKNYIYVTTHFLNSGKSSRDFLLIYVNKSRSSIRGNYFALKFYYDYVLKEEFKEVIPLAKKSYPLPEVLSREEIQKMLQVGKYQT